MENECEIENENILKNTPANEEETDENWLTSGASWGYNWLKAAKEKASSTLTLVKKDLTELGDVVATEANAIASTTVGSLQHIVGNNNSEAQKDEVLPESNEETSNFAFNWTPKIPPFSSISNNAWMKSFVDAVKSIAQEDTTSDENENIELIFPRTSLGDVLVQVDSKDPHLLTLLLDKKIYLEKPEGDEDLFTLWKNEFNLEDYNEYINSLLNLHPQFRNVYQEMVPAVFTEITFWQRCLYAIRQKVLIDICEKNMTNEEISPPACVVASKNSEILKIDEKITPVKTAKNSQKDECSSDSRSNADETWSICSSTNIEIQEINENNEGRTTPKVLSASDLSSDKSGGWVNWDD